MSFLKKLFSIKTISAEKGIALVITLMITAILVAVVTEIVYAVHMHAFMSASFKDGQRAEALAEGGVEVARQAIAVMTSGKDYSYFKTGDALGVLREDDGVLTIRAEDEQGKFPVNYIVLPNGETDIENYDAYARLLKALGLERGLADTLADWIDVNNEPRPNGAETYDYYATLARPYAAKNGPMGTIDEILLVKGYTPEVHLKLSRNITVYTDGKVNINAASKEVLMALSDSITAEMAQRVVDRREKEPFTNTAEIRKVSGFETLGFALQGRITVKSSVFRIYSRGEVGGTVKEVEAVIDVNRGGKTAYWRDR